MAQKKFSNSPLLSETKTNTKLVLGSLEPLLNKANKQNVYEIDSLINSTFVSCKKVLTHS